MVGLHSRGSSALHELGRRAPWVAAGTSAVDVAERTVESTVAVTDLTSATVWVTQPDGSHRRLATLGPDTGALTSLTESEISALDTLAADFTSCYSGGGALDLGFGATQILRERGAFAMLLAPLRDGARRVGLLCAISTSAANVAPDTVEAVELLCLHTGSRLAALDRLRQLQEMVYRDALTGVANRMRWDELLDDRRGVGTTVGWVVCVDVDRFKHINDEQGHVAGDRALRDVASELSRAPMRSTLVYRTGGDEFVLLLPPSSVTQAALIVEEIRMRASAVLHPHGADLSVGVAVVPREHRQFREAFVAADRALYVAKGRGGGMTVFADED
jgi:diguanylate cyclase (GGDEF)-like protein